MAKKYQESLDLFEKIYFKEDELLDKGGYSLFYGNNKKEYSKLGRDNSALGDGVSKIIGKSAFTPRILKKTVIKDKKEVESDRYYLTLDNQGRFDHHFDQFYTKNSKNIQEIDITDMSKEDIMSKVEQILNMSNEEIMTMFNIQETYSTKVKIELLLDDVVQQYFEQQGQEIKKKAYGPEWGIRTITDKGRVLQDSCGFDYKGKSTILINTEGKSEYDNNVDEISYKVLTPEENDISKIRITIEKANVNSELGQLILQTLQERFTEREIEEKQEVAENEKPIKEQQKEYETKQTTKEKTGAEKIIEFVEQNNLTPHDISLALTMMLAKATDKTNAEQHIINQIDKNKETSQNVGAEH